MKMSPEYSKAQANMQPGVITADGFLGDDKRPIVDIIADDEATMETLGVSFDEAVARMRHLMEEGRKGLEEPVTVDGNWIVRVSEARGFLPSPFEDGIFRKVNAQVELMQNGTPTGESVLYSELGMHLLEKYHFMQGVGAAFRMDPERLKRVLQL
ncbi:MAG: hypothetical protein EA403_08420 [Spirochaetaceae bacterium]|nr:MAG: hypothetical protein EA403_08420 [Spirochaetaceae bacterium]